MKNNYYLLFCVALIIPMAPCIVPADHNMHQTSKGETSEWDHVGMEFIFEDQVLSDATKATIATDCKSILDHLRPKGRRDVQTRTLQINHNAITITSHFLFNAEYVYYPAGVRNQFGVIAKDGDGVEYIFISKDLIDAYKAAIALSDAHADAFKLLPEFVNFLNNMDKDEMPALDQLMYLVGDRANEMMTRIRTDMGDHELRKQYNAKFIAEYNVYRYEISSILDRFIDEELLYVKLYIWKQDTGERRSGLYAVYDQDRWKLHIPLM